MENYTQQELHTEAYKTHRADVIKRLGRGARLGKVLRWDGREQSFRSVLEMVCHNTRDGQRFVRETGADNPDIQL